MRNKKTQEATISACADLTLIQHIPADELCIMAKIYETMLKSIRDAIKVSENIADKRKKSKLRVIESKKKYDRECFQMRRQERRGQTLKEIAHDAQLNQYMTREMIKHGNALARARLADIKKAYILELHRKGMGVRSTARMTANRFGNCSPAYASKIIKAYKEAIQPVLPMSALRAIK